MNINRVLLDTCALIWLLLSDRRIGDDALSIIEDSGVQKLISPVSYWEIATKSTLPKYREEKSRCPGTLSQENYTTSITDVLEEYQIRVLQFSLEHTEQLYKIDYFTVHKDPFDRIIVAKALVEGASLISSDGKLYYYGFHEIYKNVWVIQ